MRNPKNPWVREHKLNVKQVSYRLWLERSKHDEEDYFLDRYYKGLIEAKSQRDKSYVLYATFIFALFLLQIGALQNVEFFGFAPEQNAVLQIAFALVSLMTFVFSYFQAKVARYDQFFTAVFEKSSGFRKFDLVLAYPAAFTALHYSTFLSGNPKHMLPKRMVPIRLTLLLILSIPALIIALVFWAWLVWTVSAEIWVSTEIYGVFWTRIFVISCWCLMVFSVLIPTVFVWGRKYEHYGLLNMLQDMEKRDPVRHRFWSIRAAETIERMSK